MISSDLAIYLSKQLLWNAMLISSPVIAAALICGFIVSILQVATQIQDSTLTFIPKIIAIILVLMFCGEWMLHALINFSKTIIHAIPGVIKC